MRRLIVLTLALVVAGAACGDTGGDRRRPPRTTTSAPPATQVPSTVPPTIGTSSTSVGTTMATTTSDGTTTVSGGDFAIGGSPDLFPPDAEADSDGASGSGCVIGGATTLPDGVWFGYVLAVESDALTFDLACFYFGAIADSEAAEDGQEAFGGFYVRNQNTRTFSVPFGPDGVMWWLGHDESGGFTLFEIDLAAWPGADEVWPCPGELCGVWLYVNDGAVTEAYEQYVP